MYGFSHLEMESTGSADRFPIRVEKFKKKKKFLPVLQHYFWWFVHNCITHFLIGIIPVKPLFEFHDWTSIKLNAGEAAITTEIEELETCKKQLDKVISTLQDVNGLEHSIASYYAQQALDAVSYDIHAYYVQKRRAENPLKRRTPKNE